MASPVATLIVRIIGDAKQFAAAMAGTQGKLAKMQGGMAALGGKLTKSVTLPIVAIGAAAVYSAMDVGKGMRIIKQRTGETGKAAEALGKSYRKVLGEVPESTEAVGEAMALVAQRTGLVGKPLETLTTKLLALSRITGTDVKSNVDQATKAFANWSIGTQDQGKALDYLYGVSTKTGVPIDALLQKVTRFGAPMRGFGFSFEQSAAMMGSFEKAGLRSDQVMMGMTKGLASMAKAGKDPVKEFPKLIDGIKNAGTASEATAIAVQAFGARAGPALADAVRAGRLSIDELMASLAKSPASIDKVAKKTETFGQKMAKLKHTVSLALEPLGITLIDAFKRMLPAITGVVKFVGSLISAFSKLPKGVQTAGLAFLAFAAAAGPLMSIGSRVIGMFRGLGGVFSLFRSAGAAAMRGVQMAIIAMSQGGLAAVGSLSVGIGTAFAAIGIAVAAATITVLHFKKEADAARKESERAVNLTAWTIWMTSLSQELRKLAGFTGGQVKAMKVALSDTFRDLPRDATTKFSELRDKIATQLYEITGVTREQANAQANELITKWTDIKNQGGATFASARQGIVAQLQGLGVESAEQAGTMAETLLGQFMTINRDGVISFNATRTQIGEVLAGLGITAPAQVDAMSQALLTTFGNLNQGSKSTFEDMKAGLLQTMTELGVKGNAKAQDFASGLISRFNVAKAQGGGAIAALQQSVAKDMVLLFQMSDVQAASAADTIIKNLTKGKTEGTAQVTELANNVSNTPMTTQPVKIGGVDYDSMASARAAMQDWWNNHTIIGSFIPLFRGGAIPEKQSGGGIPGSGPVPIIAHGGEYMIRKSAVSKLGDRAMAMVNRGILPASSSVAVGDIHLHSVSPDYDVKRLEKLLNDMARRSAHTSRMMPKTV